MATTSMTHARMRPLAPRRLTSRLLAPVLVSLLAVSLLGVGAVNAPPAEAATKRPAASAIRYALDQLGDPYSYGANGPGRWDCSSLTRAAYKAAGVSLPRVSRDQYTKGRKIARKNWKPGDLIYWGSPIYHVGIFMGNGRVLHAPRTGRVVSIDKIWSGVRKYGTRPAAGKGRPLLMVKPGMRGDHVRAVQKRLRANGHGVKVTGHYNATTKRVVKRVQAKRGWKKSGVTGPGTWSHLVAHGAKSRKS